MSLALIRRVSASWRRPKPPFLGAEILEQLKMVTAGTQAVVDALNAIPDQIKTNVQTAITNAEASKDSDTNDGLAAVNTALKSVQDAVAAIAPAAPAQ